eukprot:979736-Rhodomonas_salina.2
MSSPLCAADITRACCQVHDDFGGDAALARLREKFKQRGDLLTDLYVPRKKALKTKQKRKSARREPRKDVGCRCAMRFWRCVSGMGSDECSDFEAAVLSISERACPLSLLLSSAVRFDLEASHAILLPHSIAILSCYPLISLACYPLSLASAPILSSGIRLFLDFVPNHVAVDHPSNLCGNTQIFGVGTEFVRLSVPSSRGSRPPISSAISLRACYAIFATFLRVRYVLSGTDVAQSAIYYARAKQCPVLTCQKALPANSRAALCPVRTCYLPTR